MSGHVGDLSPKQAETLKQFKENVKDVPKPKYKDYNDYDYTKWLRARQWDLKKAEKMFRESMAWRQKIDADNLVQWEAPEVLRKYYPGGYFGEDKEGCPLWFEILGCVDLKGVAFSAKKEHIINHRIRDVEYLLQNLLPAACKKHGKVIDQSVMVYDMEGIGRKHLWKPALDVYTELLAMLEANYPESLKNAYIINAPSFFPIAYNLCKRFLSDDTKKKLIVLGKNWKTEILKHIAADQLPVHWGGTATDVNGDPKCAANICWGGKVPEEYKINKPEVDLSKFTVQTVGRGSTIQVEAMVDAPGMILAWQFWTEGQDIGFGVFKRTADGRQKKGEMDEIVKSERVNCHIIPEDGNLVCDEPATYVLRFDNTYSWVNSKKIFYTLDVLEPASLEEIHAESFVTSL